MPTKRWWLGYLFFIACAGVADGVVTYAQLWAYSTPILIIFLIGYTAGRISKEIEG